MSEDKNRLSRFWQELIRRKVIHVIVVYSTAAFVIIELVNNVYEPLRLPDWTPLLVIVIVAIGFPVAIIISWVFDISFKGVTKTEPIQQDVTQSESTALFERPPVQEKSILVLPFENISPDPDQEYFSDGLTEEIITDLSHIHDLLVISRSSAMTFKGTNKKIGEIASNVNVRYVLEGSVRKAGNNLRITAQLIDASNDSHLWAEKYNATLEDVFNIQENVSRSIVDALKVKLSPGENKIISERPIIDAQAYDLFLRARKEVFNGTEESLEKALQLIFNGLDIIGDNEILYGALGHTYFHCYNLGIKQEENILHKVKECSDKIFSLNSHSYMGYYLRALIYWKERDIKNTIIEHKKALELNANHSDSLMQVCYFYIISGKTFAAKPILKKLIDISPLDWLSHYTAGWVEFAEGRFEQGLKSLLKMYNLDPEFQLGRFFYGHGLAYTKRFNEAYDIFDCIDEESSLRWLSELSNFYKYALHNKKNYALQAVSQDLVKFVKGDEFMPLLMAEGYAMIHEENESINWLEVLVNWGFINFPFLNNYDLLLGNIRGEERFKKLMERVKNEWENFEV